MATDLMLFMLLLATCVGVIQAELHHRELSRLLEHLLERDNDA